LHFQIKGDIASHIHIIKHRISVSLNSESARYKELTDKWYIPEDWKNIEIDWQEVNDKDIKDFVTGYSTTYTWEDILDSYTELGHKLYHLSCKQLSKPLGRKRAKESARYFLPYNKQLDFDCMFNFRSFVHFQSLRNSPHAQVEIQVIAEQMLDLVRNIPNNPFEYSLKAFGFLRVIWF
jgi:flavin-dependent thymidylate synthase